jgi:hypothetical protein
MPLTVTTQDGEDPTQAELANMTEDERRAVIVSQAEISPEKVTNQVLQICNVVRQPLAVHGDQFAYVRRRSGLGGTGGRNLSPELRIKFGTYGFSKKGSK